MIFLGIDKPNILDKPELLGNVVQLENKKVTLENLLIEFYYVKVLNNTRYKKGSEWSESKEKRYVYDLLIGLPVNKTIVINHLSVNEIEVLEGYSRLMAVRKFMEGRLLIRGYDNNDLFNYTKTLYLDFFEGRNMTEKDKEVYSSNLNSN